MFNFAKLVTERESMAMCYFILQNTNLVPNDSSTHEQVLTPKHMPYL